MKTPFSKYSCQKSVVALKTLLWMGKQKEDDRNYVLLMYCEVLKYQYIYIYACRVYHEFFYTSTWGLGFFVSAEKSLFWSSQNTDYSQCTNYLALSFYCTSLFSCSTQSSSPIFLDASTYTNRTTLRCFQYLWQVICSGGYSYTN